MAYLKGLIEDNPVIPAINHMKQIDEVIALDAEVVFVICGDIMSLPKIVKA